MTTTTSHFERLRKAQGLLSSFADSLDSIIVENDFSKAVEALLNCQGKVITTGMGKAGIAMRKFSSILCSLPWEATSIPDTSIEAPVLICFNMP